MRVTKVVAALLVYTLASGATETRGQARTGRGGDTGGGAAGALIAELASPPATSYATTPPSDRDRRYIEFLKELDVAAVYDPGLGRAARELARFQARHGRLAPTPVLAFLLESSGVVVGVVEQSVTATAESSDAPLLSAIRQVVAGGRAGRIGIGEARAGGGQRPRYIAVIASPPGIELTQPVPRRVPRGARVAIRGQLDLGVSAVEARVLGPDLTLRTPAVRVRRGRVELDVDVGRASGAVHIELLSASGRGGQPTQIARFTVRVAEPIPLQFSGLWPPDETGYTDAARVELAGDLVDGDRAQAGLAPLTRDPLLNGIAAAHSRDMAANRFVGHHSPRTGGLEDRLGRAGYRAVRHAENVGRLASVWEAEAWLMRSVGHRRNILDPEVTHLGVGVAFAERDGGRVLYVTQVFARPVANVDGEHEAAAIAEQVNAGRRARGTMQLVVDPELSRLAQRKAADPEMLPQEVLAAAGDKVGGRGYAAVMQLWELGQLDLPDAAFETGYRRLGVGLVQTTSIDAPSLTVVIVLGR